MCIYNIYVVTCPGPYHTVSITLSYLYTILKGHHDLNYVPRRFERRYP